MRTRSKVLMGLNIAPLIVAYAAHKLSGGQPGSADSTVSAWMYLLLFIVFIFDAVFLFKYLRSSRSEAATRTDIKITSKKWLAAVLLITIVLILGLTVFYISQLQI